MLRRLTILAAGCLLAAVCACTGRTDDVPRELVLDTDRGQVVIALNDSRAPLTASFVAGLAGQGLLDGHSFYRAGSGRGAGSPAELVEGGLLDTFVLSDTPTSIRQTGLPTLDTLESTDLTGLRHQRGSVSLARDVLDTGTVIPDLVIFLREAPDYDAGGALSPDGKGYPVFGEVVEGLGLFEELAREEREGGTWVGLLQGQILSDPVIIRQAFVREAPARTGPRP